MKKHIPTIHHTIAPTHETIAALAQRLYEAEGCPDGRADAHWLEAEHQLRECAEMVSSPASPQTGNTPARQGITGVPASKPAKKRSGASVR